jgi:5,6,7,8-tetrahydromethanopterin hydro-lyase
MADFFIGESLVGEGNEVAHIDLIIGSKSGAAGAAFCNALTNNKDGFTTLLAVVAPNIAAKPDTLLFNKVTIKGASVESGVIPRDKADDYVVLVGVFIHWDASDDKKIYDYNYQATKESIQRALARKPSMQDVIAGSKTAKHPFSPK